ncbi:MAG: alternative ribosome rescue aminoacyl-tRNA hydrolase ArfB [Anaerolineae bacterium]
MTQRARTNGEQDREESSIRINARVSIPLSEIRFRFARSSGPGGQRVNRRETQVELSFDLGDSPSLSEGDKQRISEKLSGYIDSAGVLHLTSQATRSQAQNRQDVTERFQRLLSEALRQPRKRKPSRPSRAAKDRRLAEKKRRSEAKRLRRPPNEAG